MKIQIMGYAGSGKSTFAANLGKIYNIVPTYLDAIHWLPNWKEQEDSQMSKQVADVMEKDNWIIEGNYSRICSNRYKECDLLFFFDFNRFTCLLGAIKRYIMFKGKNRESIGNGCIEKLDWEFIKWILHNGRTKKAKANYLQRLKDCKGQTIIFKTHRQVNKYLQNLR